MNKLPKIFCLTLKDTPNRKLYAESHFKKHNLDVTFFEGINNHKFGLASTIPYMDDFPNWQPGDSNPNFITNGHIGCILSHYMIWKTLQYLPYDEIIIFEDDVVLCDNFTEKLQNYKLQLPENWEYVFVGHCCLPDEKYQIKISENIITTIYPPMCTHAYMIKKSAIPILLDTNHLAWSHIDIQIQKRSLKILKYYIFDPPIAEQLSLMKQRNPEANIDNTFESLTLEKSR